MADKYKDEEWLREQYIEKRKTTYEMADICGVSDPTILRWMDKFGIERRGRSAAQIKHRKEAPSMRTDYDGYERISAHNGNNQRKTVLHHQLLAIADGVEPQTLLGGKYDVHHKNRLRWDNRPDNLEVLTKTEHGKIHGLKQQQKV